LRGFGSHGDVTEHDPKGNEAVSHSSQGSDKRGSGEGVGGGDTSASQSTPPSAMLLTGGALLAAALFSALETTEATAHAPATWSAIVAGQQWCKMGIPS
jgi:hypothetical protein